MKQPHLVSSLTWRQRQRCCHHCHAGDPTPCILHCRRTGCAVFTPRGHLDADERPCFADGGKHCAFRLLEEYPGTRTWCGCCLRRVCVTPRLCPSREESSVSWWQCRPCFSELWESQQVMQNSSIQTLLFCVLFSVGYSSLSCKKTQVFSSPRKRGSNAFAWWSKQ